MRWTKPCPSQVESQELYIPTQGPDEVVLPEIAGIDLADGLKRVAGNRRLYRDLLRQFVATHGNAALQISTALEGGERKLAERIAHTVKGVAGNIGITEVQSVAQKLENALRDDEGKVSALVLEFASLMGTQVYAIEKALRDSAAACLEGSCGLHVSMQRLWPMRSRSLESCSKRVTAMLKSPSAG